VWGGGGRGGDLGLLHSDLLCGAAPANRREGEWQSAESEKPIFFQPPLLLKNWLQLDFLDSTKIALAHRETGRSPEPLLSDSLLVFSADPRQIKLKLFISLLCVTYTNIIIRKLYKSEK
jgi:hypothetical protein